MDTAQTRETAGISDTDIVFETLLVPHRSLPPLGFLMVMGLLIGMSVAIGVGFSLVGAWPVLGFLGIDIILVYIAFRISYATARQSERIRLSADTLEIVFSKGFGPDRRALLQSYWARIDVEPVNAKLVQLMIRSHGRSLEIGAFLGTAEKIAFAKELTDALHWSRIAANADAAL